MSEHRILQQAELAHYGIKGQKWGVRRFQNIDGSYTPEGKERYGSGNSDKSKSGADANQPTKIGSKNSSTKKFLIGAGIVTLAAVGGYLAYKNKDRAKNIKFPSTWPKKALRGDKEKDKKKIETWYKDEIEPGLSENEKTAIHAYTDNKYSFINWSLEKDSSGNSPYRFKTDNMSQQDISKRIPEYVEKCEQYSKEIETFLDRCQTKNDMIVNRKCSFSYVRGMFGNGMTAKELADVLSNPEKVIGSVLETKGFCSTSIDSSKNSLFGGCNLHILVPKGSKGAYVAPISNSPKELEFLLQRGTRYKLVGAQNFKPAKGDSIYYSSIELFLEVIND